MALSAVSSGVFTVGRALLPIAMDIISVQVMRQLFLNATSPRSRWAIAAVPACTVVYLTSGVPKFDASGIITCCLYVAYKVVMFAKGSPHPSVQSLGTKYSELMERLTIPCNNQSSTYSSPEEFWEERRKKPPYKEELLDEVRARWRDPEIVQLADALMSEAATAMNDLYNDLQKEVTHESVQLKYEKMAELLTRKQGPHDYYSRFCKEGTVTLLDIYRAIRGISFSIQCVEGAKQRFSYSIIENCNKANQEQSQQDVLPFFICTHESKWRGMYNDAIVRFSLVTNELDLKNEEFRVFRKWCARDLGFQVAKNNADDFTFRLYPCEKPR